MTKSIWRSGAVCWFLVMGAFLVHAEEGTLILKSGINGKEYRIKGKAGTAGKLGSDYVLGTYFAGGNENKRHGFKDRYADHGGHFCIEGEPSCFVSQPSDYTDDGALEATDHNWLQATRTPIVVDLGPGNESDQAIVFASIDHLGEYQTTYEDPAKARWNVVVEAIEFTVYGSNDFADALAAAEKGGVFGGKKTEGGVVPTKGSGSTFEAGVLDVVFEDGWADFGATIEGDDYASVWKFRQPYRFIAVYANNTDPFVGDGFQSHDVEVDAVGGYLKPLGDNPTP